MSETLLYIGELLPGEAQGDVLLPLLLRVPDLPGNLGVVCLGLGGGWGEAGMVVEWLSSWSWLEGGQGVG